MRSPDLKSSKDSKSHSSNEEGPVVVHLGKAASWEQALEIMNRQPADSNLTTVIYRRFKRGDILWRQDPALNGKTPARGEEKAQHIGYEVFQAPRSLVPQSGMPENDSDVLKKAVEFVLGGGHEGPASDVGPR